MTSSFAPNFPFPGGPNSGGDGDDGPPTGSQKIFTFSPYSYTGVPTWYDWIGITNVGTDAIKNTSAPGKTYPIFRSIPDEQLRTDRPYYSVGNNEAEYGKQGSGGAAHCISYASKAYVKYMFDNTQDNSNGLPKNWGFSWNDFYSTPDKWWQFYSAFFANFSDDLYPFATKGISLRLKTPKDKPTEYFSHIAPSNGPIHENWGDHTIINQAHGLWRDLEGYYYIYELLPFGDNSLRMYSDQGTAGRNNRNVYVHEGAPARELYGDTFVFCQKNNQTKKTDKWLSELRPFIKPGEQRSLAMWTMDPMVEHLFFCGVNIEMHHDRKAGKWRPHTTMLSRVTPIPFHAPTYDGRTRAVLGEPTNMEDLKKGFRKLHFWNPPEGATDTLGDYVPPEYDPKGEDTVAPEDTSDGVEGAGIVYVNIGPYFPDEIDTSGYIELPPGYNPDDQEVQETVEGYPPGYNPDDQEVQETVEGYPPGYNIYDTIGGI